MEEMRGEGCECGLGGRYRSMKEERGEREVAL